MDLHLIQIFTIIVMVTLTNCEPPVPSYGVPQGVPITNYGGSGTNFGGNGNYGNNGNNFGNGNQHHAFHEGQDPDHLEPKSYEFGYAVKDDYSGNDYKRRETSDGNQVNGEYRVQLPDGRTQIVTYYADWQSGFHADVRYEGTAQFPEQYGNGGNYQGGNFQGSNYPSNQYGAPAVNNQFSNQGNQNFGPASSSVTIKDFSGPGTPYNTNGDYSNGGGYNYDSYANSGNFGSRTPSKAYGAP